MPRFTQSRTTPCQTLLQASRRKLVPQIPLWRIRTRRVLSLIYKNFPSMTVRASGLWCFSRAVRYAVNGAAIRSRKSPGLSGLLTRRAVCRRRCAGVVLKAVPPERSLLWTTVCCVMICQSVKPVFPASMPVRPGLKLCTVKKRPLIKSYGVLRKTACFTRAPAGD